MTGLATNDSASARKARGAFFTPPSLARYVVDWAVQTSQDTVLNPPAGKRRSCLLQGHAFVTSPAANNPSYPVSK
ncbi:hypothetical protein [Actinomycetospora atypica]|uniref:Uncharacterized protein n=1 Tax=Actinomycetospora atypica TaxID=1290095 RepID=A0ABV9YKQ4_9PSEU